MAPKADSKELSGKSQAQLRLEFNHLLTERRVQDILVQAGLADETTVDVLRERTDEYYQLLHPGTDDGFARWLWGRMIVIQRSNLEFKASDKEFLLSWLGYERFLVVKKQQEERDTALALAHSQQTYHEQILAANANRSTLYTIPQRTVDIIASSIESSRRCQKASRKRQPRDIDKRALSPAPDAPTKYVPSSQAVPNPLFRPSRQRQGYFIMYHQREAQSEERTVKNNRVASRSVPTSEDKDDSRNRRPMPQGRDQNCALRIQEIHPAAPLREIFSKVREGKVFSFSYTGPDLPKYPNAAGRLVFQTKEAAEAFFARAHSKSGIWLRGIRWDVRWNWDFSPPQDSVHQSRVLWVSGDAEEMKKDEVEELFRKVCIFELVDSTEWVEDGTRIIEFSFANIVGQSRMIMNYVMTVAIPERLKGIQDVQYGPDPCEPPAPPPPPPPFAPN